jgi:hypothetical protein
MHKDKSGKVYASLTEVKNKTGDIFALVDEFGEVFITSYNKTRYKISKVDISSLLTQKNSIPKENKTVVKKEKPTTKEDKEPEQQETTPIDIEAYDRDNQIEKDFVRNALKPLVD